MTQAPAPTVVTLGEGGLALPRRSDTPIDDLIQDAIRRLDPTNGGVVRVPAGRYVVDHVDLDADARPVTLDLRGTTLVKATAARGGTVSHMFESTYGAAEGLRVVAGVIDLSKDEFTFGQTVSAFYAVRPDDWAFYGTRFQNGIEEGLKLYMPRRVSVVKCEFDTLLDNGVQFHNVAQMPSGPGHKSDRVAEHLEVIGCQFSNINDGFSRGTLNGQAVAFSSAHATHGVRDGLVLACSAERCIRGFWAEFNVAGVHGENIRFVDNDVMRSEFHGMGFVGVRDGRIARNRLVDIGMRAPGEGTSSEVLGILVSGAANNPSEDVLIDDNSIEERRTGVGLLDPETDGFLEYGIVVRACRRVRITGRNRVSGARLEAIRIEDSASEVVVEATP